MKRRSFIATLAAGIAGLFVPWKAKAVREIVVDGNGALSWGPFSNGFLVVPCRDCESGIRVHSGNWKRRDLEDFQESRIVTETTITPEGYVVITATPEPGILE